MIPQGFLDAILANPADDTPRLVLADWLEDNGEPERGEFIRVQIALHAMGDDGLPVGHDTDGRCRCGLCWSRKRQRQLLDASLKKEAAPFAISDSYTGAGLAVTVPGDGSSFSVQVWRRGFVSDLTLTAADFLRHADALTANQPIERVTLTTSLHPNTRQQDQIVWDITSALMRRHPEAIELHHLLPMEAVITLEWPLIAFTLRPPIPFYVTPPANYQPRPRRNLRDVEGRFAGSFDP